MLGWLVDKLAAWLNKDLAPGKVVIVLTHAEYKRLRYLVEHAPAPSPRLIEAMKRQSVSNGQR